MEDFIHQHSSVAETINQVVGITKGATLSHFDHDQFLISINSTISLRDNHEKQGAILALKLKNRLERNNERFVHDSMNILPMLIVVSSGQSLVSVVGTLLSRNQSLYGFPLLLNKTIKSSVTQSFTENEKSVIFQDGGVIAVIDGNTKSKISEKFLQLRQINSLRISYAKISSQIRIFELQKIVAGKVNKEKEWLYTMQDDEHMKRQKKSNKIMDSVWHMIERDEIHDALELLEEHLDKERTTTQVFQKSIINSLISIIDKSDGSFLNYMETSNEWNSYEDMKWKSTLQRKIHFEDTEE